MPEPTPADGGAGSPEGGTKPTEPKKLDMTQEQLDAIIADRLKRAVPADYEELKQLKAEKEAADEAKKSELQKEKDARIAAEAAAKEKTSKADAKLKMAAILAEAAAGNAADAETVVALLQGNADITVSDDGEVSGAKEAVKKLLKDKPFLVKASTGRSGGEFGGNDPKTTREQIADLERRAQGETGAKKQATMAEARALKISSAGAV